MGIQKLNSESKSEQLKLELEQLGCQLTSEQLQLELLLELVSGLYILAHTSGWMGENFPNLSVAKEHYSYCKSDCVFYLLGLI